MKEVLLVDDFKPTLVSIKTYLSDKHSEKLEIHIAENGVYAIKILDSNNIDLVVTDIGMPVMDGLELLAYMSKEHPEIPVIVMTCFGTPEIEKRLQRFEDFAYLEKPLDIRELEEKILERLEAETEGHIRGFSLPSFLQLIEMEAKTCTLEIRMGEGKSFLYFKEGSLIEAETPEDSGTQAALKILSLEKAEIEIDGKCRKKKKAIDTPLHYLLLESARLQDEKNKEKEPSENIEMEIEKEVEEEIDSSLNFKVSGTKESYNQTQGI